MLPCSFLVTRRSFVLVPRLFRSSAVVNFHFFVSKVGKRVELVLFLDIFKLEIVYSVNFLIIIDLRGEKLNFKSVAKEISKLPFLAPEVQWASKFTVFARFTFPLNVSNHAHIWYVS